MDNIVAVALQNQIQRVFPDGDAVRQAVRVNGARRGRCSGGGRRRNENGHLLPNGRMECDLCHRFYTVGRFGKYVLIHSCVPND